jgi:CRP-like cAMP-binding protein
MGRPGVYDKLLKIPLFTGMSMTELESVVGETRLLFRKVERGERVASDGDPCGRLVILVEGRLCMTTTSDDHGLAVEEEMSGCHVLQPECAFGLRQRFTHTYQALTACSLISIDKKEALRLTSASLIFRLNMINLISTKLQKVNAKVWRRPPRTLQESIVRFLSDRCLFPTGRKVFRLKMARMALELHEDRRKVSRCLNALQDRGMLTLHRCRIEVPSLEDLVP